MKPLKLGRPAPKSGPFRAGVELDPSQVEDWRGEMKPPTGPVQQWFINLQEILRRPAKPDVLDSFAAPPRTGPKIKPLPPRPVTRADTRRFHGLSVKETPRRTRTARRRGRIRAAVRRRII